MRPGDTAPTFELVDDRRTPRSVTGLLAGGPVVLYFYPAAMSPWCAEEGCHFRDLGDEFTKLGAKRVGISPDFVERQREFAAKYRFDFPLLADVGRVVAKAYGVKRGFGVSPVKAYAVKAGYGSMPVKRVTFVIATDRTILEIIRSELSRTEHADRALEVLRTRPAPA